MAHIPFIGRLHTYEYVALALSFLLALIELVIRTITLLLPTPIIRFCYRVSRNAFNSLSSPYSRRARNKKKSVSSPIAQAHDFVELCELYGYYAEEHVVQTKDGYLLGLHRLAWRRGEEDMSVNAGPNSIQKKCVYLHHGLLMNSEVWVCITEKERCLPFMLVEQGYDVWLGNNRGNKYSKKNMHYAPTSVEFWDFSMDQFAFHDIPDSINYVLSTTSQPSLSYIGFSQGTAQAFATLSIHPTLNSKVDVFVALAPAMAPPGLASGVVSSLVKTNPEILFLLFGRRAILGSTTMWSAILYPAIFSWSIDKCLLFLFNWKSLNISAHQKLAAYPHLYSFTSTKSVVHWFQIIRNGKFQMFDDEVSTPMSLNQGSKYYKVAKFPTRNIRTPIVLVYGGSDSLVDIKLMLKELPRHTVARCIPKYEHLDLLWASDVHELVFPHVLEALDSYAVPENTKASALGWRSTGLTRHGSSPLLNGSQPPGYSEDESVNGRLLLPAASGADTLEDREPTHHMGMMEGSVDEHMDESDYEDDMDALALTPPQNAQLPPIRQAFSLPAALEGIAGPPLTPTRQQPELEQRSTPAEDISIDNRKFKKGVVRSPSNMTTASSLATVMPAGAGAGASAPPTTPAETKRRVLTPSQLQTRERNRRSQVSQTSDGQVTVVAASPTDFAIANAVDAEREQERDGKRIAPEGWWSNTSASSLGSKGG
ncbi:Alpha/Beta hydrolase protein [Neohortaea acidophila]|uniref:Alpha/Beta hydrolase protein n=1 Tax=Neohortaea acidophila TaxID=245834 RepID=A0A6A6PRI8_9PEZI|nr:Alpha/Beta hydrolase protein [Neohortaea acidophila]KAF2482748.1 Alpha/Beta hydrolase protein [Neohortaea acidophila]